MTEPTASDATEPAGPAARAGLSMAQYDWHVRDMAKSLLHAAGIYVLAQAAALTKLIPHPVFHEPGAGWWREIGVFACGLLGAWAVVCSTLLRDAGLRSWTVTLLVPLTLLAVAALFTVFPATSEMSSGQVVLAVALVSGPGPVAWALTMRRWRIERRRAGALLAAESAA